MIKSILKNNNILLSQFASDLNVSRPTLDLYIKNYDSGQKITNNLYQKIFNFLFEDKQISPEEFRIKYNYVIENYGKKTDILNSSISSTKNLYLSSGSNDNLGQELFEFLNDEILLAFFTNKEYSALAELLTNRSELLKELLKYQQLLNGSLDIKDLTKLEIMSLATLHNLNKKLERNDSIIDKELKKELTQDFKSKQKVVADKNMKKQIVDYIKNNKDENLSLEELMQKIKENFSTKE